ncbi:MAG: DNA polymerase III subunit alpha [Deltaproteobacteria bacterium]|nr:DNA polymerase III subunit alpha [Deltaproteobacteria bacterium]
MSFIHLHVRSAYSFLRGTIQIRELAARARALNMPAVALTDLGQMFGIWKFYREAVKAGVKPILGVEAFVASGDRRDHAPDEEPGTLVLLAKDLTGYRNLTRLTARANMEGFFHQPRVDRELLKEHSEGLIALSSGSSGWLYSLLARDRYENALEWAARHARIFPGRFYLELQGNGLPDQNKINEILSSLGKVLGLPLVVCAEARYLNREDHSTYEVLQRIRERRLFDYEKSQEQPQAGEFHFKGPTEMKLEFGGDGEAVGNVFHISELCNVDFPEKRIFAVPRPDIGARGLSPEDFQSKADDHFLKLCREGLDAYLKDTYPDLEKRDPDLLAIYQTRLRKETSDILETGASLYFLVVADYAAHAKSQGVLTGPGRGPAGASLACLALGITELDPIRYGLPFELFLNTLARDYPSIDLEVPTENALELVNYITDTYGGSHFVAHGLKLELLNGRALLREVGQVFGVPLPLLDELCGMLPTHSRISLKTAVDEISLIKTFAASIPVIKKIIDYALFLENLPRAAGSRPYSLVASPRLLRDSVPLFLDYNSYSDMRSRATVQYGEDAVEENGLLRFDIVPQRSLSFLASVLKLAARNGKSVSLKDIPADDPKTAELFAGGNFAGIPYLENPWVGNLVRGLQEVTFNDLVALAALHPPLSRSSGLLEEYLRLRKGILEPSSLHPALDPILSDTMGLILFNEQIVEMAEKTARLKTSEAEIMSRGLSLGDPDELSQIQASFSARAVNNGFDPEDANNVFIKLRVAAPVTLPKPHAVSLALTTYRAAYLKAHFPTEYMDAFLRSGEVNREKQESALKEWRQTHLRLVPAAKKP